MLNILTFVTNGPHSTCLYDKKEDCSFTITHFPQNSTILPRIEFYFHTSTLLASSLYSDFFQRHHILSTRLLNQECLKNRLILGFKK